MELSTVYVSIISQCALSVYQSQSECNADLREQSRSLGSLKYKLSNGLGRQQRKCTVYDISYVKRSISTVVRLC